MERIYLLRAVKQGNSMYMRLPVEHLKALNIRRGDYLVMALYTEDILVVRKPTDEELLQLKPKDIEYGI